jgi:hypothetical protein
VPNRLKVGTSFKLSSYSPNQSSTKNTINEGQGYISSKMGKTSDDMMFKEDLVSQKGKPANFRSKSPSKKIVANLRRFKTQREETEKDNPSRGKGNASMHEKSECDEDDDQVSINLDSPPTSRHRFF